MKKVTLSKKSLSPEEADRRIQNLFQIYFTVREDTMYRKHKAEVGLDRIDSMIMLICNDNPEKHIQDNLKQMQRIWDKIHLDYGRFVKVENRVAV